MGEAIARFREAALATRREKDETFSYLRWEVAASAARSHSMRCRQLLRDFEAGRVFAMAYARKLLDQRRTAERRAILSEGGQKNLSVDGWLHPSMELASPPNVRLLADAAAREAIRWGRLFKTVEARIRALSRATAALAYRDDAATYGKALSRWQRAFDALAPFTEEPPAEPQSDAKQKTGSGKRAGRPQNDERLARELLDGWRAYEPEEGRKTKDGFLAQLPEVRTLRTPEARERKIIALRRTLNSALHLKNEKTKATSPRRN